MQGSRIYSTGEVRYALAVTRPRRLIPFYPPGQAEGSLSLTVRPTTGSTVFCGVRQTRASSWACDEPVLGGKRGVHIVKLRGQSGNTNCSEAQSRRIWRAAAIGPYLLASVPD